MTRIELPASAESIAALKTGDVVKISGVMITARDAGHKFLVEHFIERSPQPDEAELFRKLSSLLRGGVIYHCGPVVAKDNGSWRFVSAGPTTSIREEPYEHKIIEAFGVRGIVGKGGMGEKTLEACKRFKAVYLHAVGGAASLIASSVVEVLDVHKLEFGVPEAFWVIRVKDFDAVVTMDSHGESLHKKVEETSTRHLDAIIKEIIQGK
ncbi:MAG: fumarate hydratase C-terminal domain-containing protein [Chitinivibrionia bacterium]|nr:fumarate hydratase C-terminal domain-containing protein [Chitinivibrionia bacterium]